jgi:hypothetical protein
MTGSWSYPETPVTSPSVVSCGRPDLNVESQTADASGELGRGASWVTAAEMIGAEILRASTVGHM